MKEITNLVKKRIDDYLEFDSDEIFKQGDIIHIFGGAIRDSIAGQKINDIDIMVAPISFKRLVDYLVSIGYINQNFVKMDSIDMYKDIRVINEPITLTKNGKIIQLIRPVNIRNSESYNEKMNKLITNVDISSCALSYNGNVVKEHLKDVISHCKGKVFFVDENATMSTNRRYTRTSKMLSRGWKQIDKEKIKPVIRDIKLKEILNS